MRKLKWVAVIVIVGILAAAAADLLASNDGKY